MDQSRILLIDDELPILDMISIVLRKEGFTNVQTARTGEEAVTLCKSYLPHIIVLDIMLPDIDGFEVCRQCRKFTLVPILFLTAKSTDLDKLMGFGIGGDDYVTKPFNPLELVARIKAQLRRVSLTSEDTAENGKIYDYQHFQVNEISAELIVNGEKKICPAREFQLLLFFCEHPNRVFSRNQLYEQVWGEMSYGEDNTVMVHIRRLREKIEPDPSNPRYLLTVRGLGYKLMSPLED